MLIEVLNHDRAQSVKDATHLGTVIGVQVRSMVRGDEDTPGVFACHALKREQATLVGLHKEDPKKTTAMPTTGRLLQAFSNLTLTIVHLPDCVMRHVTLLTPLQMRILERLDLPPEIYRSLTENST